MRTLVLTGALLLALSASASAQDHETQVVTQTLIDAAHAFERGDAAALDRLYADGFLNVTPSKASLAGKSKFDAVRQGSLTYESITVDDAITQVHGAVAVSSARVTVKGRNAGQDISGSYRVTSVLEKKHGHWRIVASVNSTPLPVAPPASIAPSR